MELKNIIFDKRLSNLAKTVYCFLFFSKNESSECSITDAELCESLSMSPGTLRKYLKELKDNSFISVKKVFIDNKLCKNVFVVKGVSDVQSDHVKKIKKQELLDKYPPEYHKKLNDLLDF